jgi:hypothetical protein
VLRRTLFPLFLVAVFTAAAISEFGSAAPAGAGNASTGASDAVARPAAASSLTAKAVKAATAFRTALSAAQQAKLQFSFSSSKKESGWSNLPTTFVPRNGVKIADLDAGQKAKLSALLKTILSSQGLSDEEAIRKADTYLSQQPNKGDGGPVGDNATTYGEGLYYVAFFGTPSMSKKWTVQFGGHHLAIHMTFSGSTVSNTPYFIGVEPSTTYTVDGKTYQPMKDEAGALFGAVQSLSAAEKTTAQLSQTFDDVLVGPQKDGKFPAKQGVTVGSLSAAQQALVTKAIKTYVGDMPTAQANARIAAYKKQYAQTKLAWSKSTDPTVQGAYVRLQGPRVWIEIVVQNGIVLSGVHYHSIERDIKTDYGSGT